MEKMADSVRASEMAIKMEITARQIHFFFVVFFLSFFCCILYFAFALLRLRKRRVERLRIEWETKGEQPHRSSCLVALGHTAHLVEL